MTRADAQLLREWRNDPLAVRNSRHARPVTAAEHEAWLDARLADPGCALWIGEVDGVPVGHARLEPRAAGLVELSFVIAPEARGRGYVSQLLAATVADAASRAVATIVASVRPGNRLSRHVLERAGFVECGTGEDGLLRMELHLVGDR